MRLPADYELIEELHREGPRAIVRARQQSSNERVILELQCEGRASLHGLAAVHHGYAILERLDIDGVPRARALLLVSGRPCLVMDDHGSRPLRAWMRQGPATIEQVLALARALARTLIELHAARVIHKNITPDHILVDPQTHAIQLIDFSIASVLPRETQKLASPDALEGQLPYIAPEQTGRMNRAIDFRTDFYSLGVTLYELLTGRLPFDAETPLEWVHCHIAKTPIPLQTLRPECPPALAAVVMKLFAKTAELRYQSAQGLLHDLEQCERIADDPAANAAFVAGQHELRDRFQLPQRLYGREQQLRTLLEAFEEVSEGSTALMLVAGYSGIGKTSLIAELHKPIVRDRGYFISGKFDQLKRDIPCASLIQAFEEFVRQLMTESEARLARWREQLRAALGADAQVLVEVLPGLEKIIGSQPAPQPLPAAEAQNRFNRVFQDFVRACGGPEHPLALFVDDLQWADSASLKLLELLSTDPHSSHVFLIGAYRDNEVDAAHPLTLMLEQLAHTSAKVQVLPLGPLTFEQVSHFVADTVHHPRAKVSELARLIHTRTQGNPFFVSQCLRELHARELLRFDHKAKAWTWELQSIEQAQISGDVIELMTTRLSRLDADTRELLSLAACIGNSFDVETLALVAKRELQEVARALWPALNEGMVVPQNDACRVLQRGRGELAPSETHATISCRFLHDRVQQAAYALISPADKQRVHLDIGRRLLSQHEQQGEDWLFDIVNHMNIGAQLLDTQDARLRLAELNLRAGGRARDSTAYASAINYLDAGRALLPISAWQTHYAQTFELHKLLSECCYLHGEFERSEQLFELLLQRARDRHAKAEIHNIRIAFYSSVGRFRDAIDAGFEGLELYGIELRSASADLEAAIESSLAKIEARRGQRDWSELAALPQVRDEAVEDCMHLLMNLTTQTYIGDQRWFPLVAMKMVELSLEHGNSRVSAFAYAYMGVVLGSLRGQYEAGHALGELALALNEQLGQTKLACKLHWIHGGLISHWARHIREDAPLLRASVRHGIETGDYVFGSWAYYYMVVSVLLSGESLERTLSEADSALAFFRKIKNKTYADLQEIVRNVVLNLQGASHERRSLSDHSFDEEACIADMRARSHGPGLGRYHALKLLVLCTHELYAEACELGAASEQTLCFLTAQPLLAEHHYYYGVALCQQAHPLSEDQRTPLLDTARACHERLRQWARAAPDNFQHKALLLEAELARLDAKLARAMRCYEQAAERARAGGFVHDAAMSHLLASKCFAAQQLPTAAAAHLRSARDHYACWGAHSRVEDLEARHPELAPLPTLAVSSDPGSVDLDAMTLSKSTRAISSELRIDELLTKVVEIMVESAGAQRAYVLRVQGDAWELAAHCHADSADEDQTPRWAEGVLNYVRHGGEPLVLGHALAHDTFGADPHIIERGIESLLCMPMRHQGGVVAYLYLENALLRDTFTPERVEMLELLTAQATVSMRNAELYTELGQLAAELERRVAKRTEQLRETNQELALELELRAQRERERDQLQREVIAMQEARVLELSTPLIPITRKIVAMPLIGSMDRERAERVMEVVLNGARARRARVVIMDVTGLQTVDTATADTLMRCAGSLRLLGVNTILTGIRPKVALTLVQLGLSLDIATYDTLQSGIAKALSLTREHAALGLRAR